MQQIPVVVVLPCLDEEDGLLGTSTSLGFGRGSDHESDVHLVVVDNGSSDRTLDIAEAIRARSVPGAVSVMVEGERGYVPPRHTGTRRARDLAETAGWSDVLIVQADADTIYTAGYIDQLRRAADAAGRGGFLEGRAEFPAAFRESSQEYVSLCAAIDTRAFSRLKMPPSSDLICTDSVCAFRLSDYEAWGGHIREHATGGDEIHAETTRLYMRSLARGSHKVSVPDALAYPSARKAERRPGEEFATAGFPREVSWREAWRTRFPYEASPGGLMGMDGAELEDAIRVRERHIVALFGVLPLHVFRALGRDAAPGCDARLQVIADELPTRDVEVLFQQPGVFIEDVLALVDDSKLWLPGL